MSETSAVLTRTINEKPVPPQGTFSLDTAHSVVGFVVRHAMVSKVRGQFNRFEGAIHVGEDPASSSVEVTIDVSSIDTREEKRDEHLRSSDFFSLEEYPTITFHSTKVVPAGSDWQVEGDLTIKGITRPVTLDLEYNGTTTDPWGGIRSGFSVSTEINREDFGLTYNAALEAGGVLIGKSVRIEIEIEAVLQS